MERPGVAQIVWFFERISSLFFHPTGWAGSVALGVLLMTVVLKTSEEALRTVTNALRRASYSLSATSAKTVMKVIIPAAATAICLGMARVAGETAPLLFTAGGLAFCASIAVAFTGVATKNVNVQLPCETFRDSSHKQHQFLTKPSVDPSHYLGNKT